MVSKEELTQFIADTYIATYGCIKNNQNYNSSLWLKQAFNQKIFDPNEDKEQTVSTQFSSLSFLS